MIVGDGYVDAIALATALWAGIFLAAYFYLHARDDGEEEP